MVLLPFLMFKKKIHHVQSWCSKKRDKTRISRAKNLLFFFHTVVKNE